MKNTYTHSNWPMKEPRLLQQHFDNFHSSHFESQPHFPRVPEVSRASFDAQREALYARRDDILERMKALQESSTKKQEWTEYIDGFHKGVTYWDKEYDRIANGHRRVFQRELDKLLKGYRARIDEREKSPKPTTQVEQPQDTQPEASASIPEVAQEAVTQINVPKGATVHFKFDTYVNPIVFSPKSLGTGSIDGNGFRIERDRTDKSIVRVESELKYTYTIDGVAPSVDTSEDSAEEILTPVPDPVETIKKPAPVEAAAAEITNADDEKVVDLPVPPEPIVVEPTPTPKVETQRLTPDTERKTVDPTIERKKSVPPEPLKMTDDLEEPTIAPVQTEIEAASDVDKLFDPNFVPEPEIIRRRNYTPDQIDELFPMPEERKDPPEPVERIPAEPREVTPPIDVDKMFPPANDDLFTEEGPVGDVETNDFLLDDGPTVGPADAEPSNHADIEDSTSTADPFSEDYVPPIIRRPEMAADDFPANDVDELFPSETTDDDSEPIDGDEMTKDFLEETSEPADDAEPDVEPAEPSSTQEAVEDMFEEADDDPVEDLPPESDIDINDFIPFDQQFRGDPDLSNNIIEGPASMEEGTDILTGEPIRKKRPYTGRIPGLISPNQLPSSPYIDTKPRLTEEEKKRQYERNIAEKELLDEQIARLRKYVPVDFSVTSFSFDEMESVQSALPNMRKLLTQVRYTPAQKELLQKISVQLQGPGGFYQPGIVNKGPAGDVIIFKSTQSYNEILQTMSDAIQSMQSFENLPNEIKKMGKRLGIGTLKLDPSLSRQTGTDMQSSLAKIEVAVSTLTPQQRAQLNRIRVEIGQYGGYTGLFSSSKGQIIHLDLSGTAEEIAKDLATAVQNMK